MKRYELRSNINSILACHWSIVEKTVLVVEDEPKLASLLEDYLTQSNYNCHCLYEGGNAVEWVKEHSPDMVLLDVMLPGKDGLQICREIRTFSQVPIIMLTARVEEIDRLMGLELGADDYVCKPYSPREVMARIKAIFRRMEHVSGEEANNTQVYRGVTVDEQKFSCCVDDQDIELTPVEMRLLVRMLQKPGQVFNRSQLMAIIYTDQRVVSDRTIDSHIKNLRRKLNSAARKSDLIHSIYGIGYKLE